MRTIALTIVVVCCGAAALYAAETLIPNGGFERATKTPFRDTLDPEVAKSIYPGVHDSPCVGWGFGGGWDGGTYTAHLSDEAHSGKHSIEIRCGKKGRGGIACSPFKLKPGSILQVTLWVKAKDAEGRVILNYEGTPGDGWHRVDLPTGTYDWTKITRRCVVPVRHARADGQTIALFIYSRASGSVWVDDVTAQEVTAEEIADAPDEPALVAPRPKDIPEPADSIGYRVTTATALDKVMRDTDYAPATSEKASISMARNEYEAFQVVVEAPWRDVKVDEVKVSDFAGPDGATLPASAIDWRRVDFIETTFVPNYPVPMVGWYPDPLMPADPFTVKRYSRAPLWFTVKTPKDQAPGVYKGTVAISPEGMKPSTVQVTIDVYDFALTDQTHLRTLTWLGLGVARAFYGYKWSREDQAKMGEMTRRYQDICLAHRLGVGGQVAAHPHKGRDGKWDFSGIDRTLERLIGEGMNAFIMGTAPNLRRQGKKEYTPEFMAQFTEMLKAYGDHLREKGWIDKAYVYTYDEAPKSAWPEVKKIAAEIKKAAPELRILQCLNQPEGVKALEGSVDVFDVYVAQYHKTGVENLQKRGTEVWLAVCCYPMDHPNLFIEYPLIDARIIPMFCWKYNAQGFEYWSVTSWGTNWRGKGGRWPERPWDPNTFGKYNGDGYLVYPGADGVPWSSIRFEALRDGFEDYEYMWTLNELVKKAEAAGRKDAPAVASARELLRMNDLIADSGTFVKTNGEYFAFRGKVAEAIVAVKRLVGEK